MNKILKSIALLCCCCLSLQLFAIEGRASLKLKVPGNPSYTHLLTKKGVESSTFDSQWVSDVAIPAIIFQKSEQISAGKERLTIMITATEEMYFNYSQQIETGFNHEDCQFYMPGFWYRRNLRSPEGAPSFNSSDSWVVREDRLSAPLTAIYDQKNGAYLTAARIDDFKYDALTTHNTGEVIVSGTTSIGHTGFENIGGKSSLIVGYPYLESPKSYIRKLTLVSPVTAFQKLDKGSSVVLTWEVTNGEVDDFSDLVETVWEQSYDTYTPATVKTPYSIDTMKAVLSNFFVESMVKDQPLKYTSGVHLRTDDCESTGSAEVGFVGRVLLNAFNALEYGNQTGRQDLIDDSYEVFNSYLTNGFTDVGFFKEFVDFKTGYEEPVHSIRRQSEGIYAILHFLNYEKDRGRKHLQWELKIEHMLDMFLTIQNEDGSFPRKFIGDFTLIDKSGGSTPCATLPMVMGYKYFKNKEYLTSAKRTADYLEKELISKADYFSSTLDSNCEDKEAALYAATATYYLSLISKGEEQEHYAQLCKKATYFALSWYYVWDVPFAKGQMLGDIGLKTRGWGNVSVENNHIDVYAFEFASVLSWLSHRYDEVRFEKFADVISTSMRQLLPYEGHLCGVAKRGYYPEVVQHTHWDYGKNGKGYYNDIFAPGWTVASLWELYTPGRTEKFLLGK